MSTNEWTPGPWRVRTKATTSGLWLEIHTDGPHYDDGSEFVIAESGAVASKPNGKRWRRTPDADRIEANARLIVAAPELVEMLSEWSGLADHLQLSTERHRERTRALLARIRGVEVAQ